MSKIRFLPVIVFVLFQLDIFQLRSAREYDSALKTYAFAELNVVTCALFAILVYIRYRQINGLIDQHLDLKESSDRTNKKALEWGLYFCFGWFIVATCFQVKVFLPSDLYWSSVHYASGLCCFGFCIAYFRLQALFTYNMFPYIGFRRLARIRSILTAFCIMLYTIFGLLGAISQILYYGTQFGTRDYNYVQSFYTASLIFESILAIISFLYILTFAHDFKSITVSFDQQMISVHQIERMEIYATEKI